MTLRVSGKNLELGEALRDRVSQRVVEAIDKYFDGGWSGHVTIAPEGAGFKTECVLHLDSGIVLHAHGEALDAHASCDDVAVHIEKRLRRYKRRLKRRYAGGSQAASEPLSLVTANYVLSAPNAESEEDDNWNPAVIAETTASLSRMSVRDAVLELDLTGAPVILFRHANHGRINVIYRRPDGHIGWIDPPATPAEDSH